MLCSFIVSPYPHPPATGRHGAMPQQPARRFQTKLKKLVPNGTETAAFRSR
jgi:hypothetical protein